MDPRPHSIARASAAVAVLLLVAAACARNDGAADATPDGDSVEIPTTGVFTTSAKHFDRVIASGGLPTVVNVWASWCIPCRTETPLLVERAERYQGDIRFLGLNTQDDRQAALDFIDEFGIPYPSGLDPHATVTRHLKVLGLPATYFYQPGGELAFAHQGEIRADGLDEKISQLLSISASGRARAP